MLESSKKGEEEKADEKKSEKKNEEKVEGIDHAYNILMSRQ